MPATGRAIKALIAEPSEKSRRSIGRFLRGKGLETVEVSDGSKALAEALLGRESLDGPEIDGIIRSCGGGNGLNVVGAASA